MKEAFPEIDLVYLWVDGKDPVWNAKKQNALNSSDRRFEINTKGRYVDNEELKFSLRSIEQYLPWIRKVFIVTDNQKPDWLNLQSPKLQIVSHEEILPAEVCPCFNSVVIEYFIYRIPGLSDYFLYANDDMFVHADLSPSYFFADDGYPIVRLQYHFLLRTEFLLKRLFGIRINNYRKSIKRAIDLIGEKFGVYYSGILHHNIDAYRKEDLRIAVEEVFKEELLPVLSNRFRSPFDIQRVLFQFYMLVIEHGHLKFTSRKESLRIRMQNPDFMGYIKRFNPDLFCLNDTERATDKDRARVKPFLESLFPGKSSFER